MLLDDEEIQIMASALQPQLRERDGTDDNIAKAIYADFLAKRDLTGNRVLELGPGQFDLVRTVAAAGATVVAMDHDPAVVALGKKRGYDVILADVTTFDWSSLRGEFDGLISRAAISPTWFRDNEASGAFVDAISSVLRPDGWGWILPWNSGIDSADLDRVLTILRAQREAFVRNGFRPIIPGPRHGAGRRSVLYVRR